MMTSREAHLVAVVGGEGGEVRGADDGGDDQNEQRHRGEHRARPVVRPTAVPREEAETKLLRRRRRVACFSRRVGTHHRGAVRVRATGRRRGFGRPGVHAVSAHARPPRSGRGDPEGDARGALWGPTFVHRMDDERTSGRRPTTSGRGGPSSARGRKHRDTGRKIDPGSTVRRFCAVRNGV